MRQSWTRTVDVEHVPAATSPQKVRWGAVFAGTVLGLGLLALLSTLWFALAYGSGFDEVQANLEWYVGISAIVCLFVAGLLAGWLSGVRSAAAGAFNGMTIWAMILLLTLVIGVPSIISVFNLGQVSDLTDGTTDGTLVDSALWATFWSIIGGLLASALGGAVGGATTTPANADLVVDRDGLGDRRVIERDVDDDDVVDVETDTRRVS